MDIHLSRAMSPAHISQPCAFVLTPDESLRHWFWKCRRSLCFCWYRSFMCLRLALALCSAGLTSSWSSFLRILSTMVTDVIYHDWLCLSLFLLCILRNLWNMFFILLYAFKKLRFGVGTHICNPGVLKAEAGASSESVRPGSSRPTGATRFLNVKGSCWLVTTWFRRWTFLFIPFASCLLQ